MVVTVHGFRFSIQGHGRGFLESSEFRAASYVEIALRKQDESTVAAVWAVERHRGTLAWCGREVHRAHELLCSIEHAAARHVSEPWDDFSVSISAFLPLSNPIL
jgi:hypothetical protein